MENESVEYKKPEVLKLTTPPEWLKPEYIAEKNSFWLHNTSYEYAVIDTAKIRDDQEEKLENERLVLPDVFVIRTDGFLAVSDTYPEPYRELAIIHEVREFSSIAKSADDGVGENACAEALAFELDQAKFFRLYAKDMSAYYEFRQSFFNKLISFYEQYEKTPEQEALLARMRHSLDYLDECIGAAGSAERSKS